MTTTLPSNPNFDHLKREAKALLKLHKVGDSTACQTLKNLKKFESRTESEILGGEVTLLEVQQAVSVEYGFSNWAELKRHIESRVARINTMTPVLGIGSYEEAVAHYVDWLGFNLDWEWREAPGQPVIMAISRDSVSFMLNEHPDTSRGANVHMKVSNLDVLAEEWNTKRPGSVNIRIGPPYEFPDLPITDPFGNTLVFESENSEEEQKKRGSNVTRMREYVRQKLDKGLPFPTPEEIREAIGPDLGTAIEVLNEFPGYGEAYDRRKRQKFEDLKLKVIELSPQPVLVIERETSLQNLPDTVSDILPRVYQHIDAQDRLPTDRPFMRILNMSASGLKIQCGYPVEDGTKDGGDIELRQLPGGRAVTGLYTGPHNQAADGWSHVIDFAHGQGFKLDRNWGGMGGWQVYINDSDEETQSQLCLPVDG